MPQFDPARVTRLVSEMRKALFRLKTLKGGNVLILGEVANNATVVSTSTRNFDNRMGIGAQVFLSSAYVAAVAALLGRIPTLEEYSNIFLEKVQPRWDSINQPLRF